MTPDPSQKLDAGRRADREHALRTKRCEVCKRDVPINDWDYGVCGACRRLATGEDY